MKKLMIAAAIVCAAAFANAASMDWQVITGTDGLDIYICSSITEFENAAQIESYLYGTSGNTGTSASQSRGAWFGDAGIADGIDTSLVGLDKPFYAVVVDASGKGYYTKAGTAEIYNTNPEPVLGLVDMSTLIASGNYTPWAGGPGPEPIPEPTSAMLLLLGVAGLALKRKQA